MVDQESWLLGKACELGPIEFAAKLKTWEDLNDQDGPEPEAERHHRNRRYRFVKGFDKAWGGEHHHGSSQGSGMHDIFQHYLEAETLADWDKARAEHGDEAAYITCLSAAAFVDFNDHTKVYSTVKNLVFCDFDGTISQRDIGYNLFHHFSGGRNDALLPDWISGAMTTRDCLRAEAELVKATREEIYAFLDQFELTPGFLEFVQLCESNDAPLVVLSDGLDFYIEYVLEKHGLTRLPVVTNQGIPENGTIRVEFPHDNHECESCGSCKAERIKEHLAKHGPSRTIFVGDGYSDACATREADVLFANKDLEKYCKENNIAHYSYDSFHDITKRIIELGFMSS